MKCSFLVAVMLVVLAACAVEGPSVGTDTRGWPDKLNSPLTKSSLDEIGIV